MAVNKCKNELHNNIWGEGTVSTPLNEIRIPFIIHSRTAKINKHLSMS